MSAATHKTEVGTHVHVDVPAQRTKPTVRRTVPQRPPTRRRVAGAPRVLARAVCVPRRPRLSLVWVLGVASVACAAVVGLGALSNAMVPPLPEETTVVEVKLGENLWELAGRVAPDSDPSAVVDRIRDLNNVEGPIHPGQSLTVPFQR